MAFRVSMLARERDPWSRRVAAAVRGCLGSPLAASSQEDAEPALARLNGGFAALCVRHPDLVVAMGMGHGSLEAAIYRALRRSAALLLCVTAPPQRLGRLARFTLVRADAVLTAGGDATASLAALGVPRERLIEMSDVLAPPAPHPESPDVPRGARQVLFVGDLSPEAGAADLLVSARAWAERNPGRALTVRWAGEGDLRIMLAAQPLPGNLRQEFLPRPSGPELAALLRDTDLLAQPFFAATGWDCTPIALAAGVPVLGSLHSAAARLLVQDGETGWLCDPRLPGALTQALDRALRTTAPECARMRAMARAWHGFEENLLRDRIRDAVAVALAPKRRALLMPEAA